MQTGLYCKRIQFMREIISSRRYIHNHPPLETLPKALFEEDSLRLAQDPPPFKDVLALLSTDGRGRKRKLTKQHTVPQSLDMISSDEAEDAEDFVKLTEEQQQQRQSHENEDQDNLFNNPLIIKVRHFQKFIV